MQKKIKTVIASVLKPVDDTRMFEKLGLSLRQSNKYDINIIGFRTKNKNLPSDIRFYPAFHFSRLSIRRFLAPLKFILLTFRIKPDLIIITTHELITPAVLYKLLNPQTKLVYDVQENYFRNTLYHGSISRVSAYLAAYWIRAKELLTTTFFSTYFLAEKGYTKEFSFSKKREIVLLNKYKVMNDFAELQLNEKEQGNIVQLVYTGTIHEVYGIRQAINLAKKISKYLVVNLLVIGSTKNESLLNELANLASIYPWLQLKIETEPVPHACIIQAIARSDFGIVSHQPVPSIANCFPTRIYELMAFQKPILLQDHEPWTTFCRRWDSAISLDFNNFDAESIAQRMCKRNFYKFGPPHDIYWESEEKKLLTGLDQLFV